MIFVVHTPTQLTNICMSGPEPHVGDLSYIIRILFDEHTQRQV